MVDITTKCAIAMYINEAGKVECHIHNQEMKTEELLDALHAIKQSAEQRIDQVLTKTMGMTYEEYTRPRH